MTFFKNWYLLAGITLFALLLGVPMYKMVAFVASVAGWPHALISLAKAVGYGTALGGAYWLVLRGAGKVEVKGRE
jgi:hypothetical protein